MMGALLAQTTSHPGCIFVWMRQFLLLLVRFVQAALVLLVNPMQRLLSRCSNSDLWDRLRIFLRHVRSSFVGNRSRSALRNWQKMNGQELRNSCEGSGQEVSARQPDLSVHSRLDAGLLLSEMEGILWATTEAWGVGQYGAGAHCVSAGGRSRRRWQRLGDTECASASMMGLLWNWNGTSDVAPSWGRYLDWQLDLQQDDLVFRVLPISETLSAPCSTLSMYGAHHRTEKIWWHSFWGPRTKSAGWDCQHCPHVCAHLQM